MQAISSCELDTNHRGITYYRKNSVIIKNAIFLNIMHNIFNLRDTEVGCDIHNISSIPIRNI